MTDGQAPGAPTVTMPSGRRPGRVKNLLQQNGLIIFFGLLMVVFAAIEPNFVSTANIRNVLISASLLGILATGQTIVVITGGFDLSVARNAVVTGMVLALLVGVGPVLAILGALAVAVATGFVNGVLISGAKVNPFVVTLGMYTVLGSVALLLNNGGSISGMPNWLIALVNHQLFGISAIVYWFIAIAILLHIVLAYTKFGRHVFAVGGNAEAARVSGIKVKRIITGAYMISGLTAGMAGILATARLRTASPVALPGMELDAIAAVIIGGTRLSGGFGSIGRTIVGVLILASLSSGLVLLGVAAYWQGVFKGAIIILAVAVDVVFNRRDPA